MIMLALCCNMSILSSIRKLALSDRFSLVNTAIIDNMLLFYYEIFLFLILVTRVLMNLFYYKQT
jgi:hypothetical protein